MNTDRQAQTPATTPNIYLIGGGVVGKAILAAHLQAGCPVALSDQNPELLRSVTAQFAQSFPDVRIVEAASLGNELPTLHFWPPTEPKGSEPENQSERESDPGGIRLAIESITENKEAKRSLLSQLQSWLGKETILCSNTSTLPIHTLTDHLEAPEKVCGMHFFMPVDKRPLVEIVIPEGAAEKTIQIAVQHATRIGKPTLPVADSPGFVVNRMLSPYINEALLLLGEGASAEQIEQVSREFGMPMSPLELIDWIGPRTAFDAGRVYWQAFPKRIDPAPILTGMVKSKKTGRGSGEGFYSYSASGERSQELAPAAAEIIQRYSRHPRAWTPPEIRAQLFLPMLIEADLILADQVVTTTGEIETAMRGGLGFEDPSGFFSAFRAWGKADLAEDLYQRRERRSFSSSDGVLKRVFGGV